MSDNNQPPQTQPPAIQYVTSGYPAMRADDEIDLKELILGLWAEKWLIVGVTAVCTAIALAYALLATPYFKTEAKIRPVPEQYLATLNNTQLIKLKSSEVFVKVYGMLESRATQQAFMLANKPLFSTYFEGQTDKEAFAAFLNDGFQLSLPDEKKDAGKGYFITTTYVAPQGIDGAAVMDGYFNFVAGKVKVKILAQLESAKNSTLLKLNENLNTKAEALKQSVDVEVTKLLEADLVKKNNLNDKKTAILKELENKRKNSVAVLEEALAVAKKLNIQDPKTISSFGTQSKFSSSQGGAVITEVNSGTQPLYFMGVNALSAEIDVLKGRKNEAIADSRIAEIDRQLSELENNRKIEALGIRVGNENFYRDIDILRTEVARLNGLSLVGEMFQVFEVSDPAYTDQKKVKPRRALIVILGALLGGMLGLFGALIRYSFGKR